MTKIWSDKAWDDYLSWQTEDFYNSGFSWGLFVSPEAVCLESEKI